jgi:hypothetical protein
MSAHRPCVAVTIMTGIVAEHPPFRAAGANGTEPGSQATREYLVRVMPARMISQRDLPG